MKKITYYDERDINVRRKIEELKKKLPIFCSEYATSELSAGKSSLTVYNYLTDISIFIDYLADSKGCRGQEISVIDLESLAPKDIMVFLDCQRLGRGRELNGKIIESKSGNNAIARKLSSVKSLYRFLFNNDLIKSNMTTKIESQRVQKIDFSIKRLERDEADCLLSAPEQKMAFSDKQSKYLDNTLERDQAIISFFLATGVRVSELVGINVTDIDLRRLNFVVTRKGGNIERLYFAEDLAQILRIWSAKRDIMQIPADEPAFFVSLQRKRMSVSTVEKMISKYAYAVLGKKLSPHKLRATYGTELYKKTHDIYKVATALGHSSVDTTRRHYADFDEERKKEIAGEVPVGRNR